MSLLLESRIFTRLSTFDQVRNIVSDRVYPGVAPHGAAFPYIVFGRVSGATINAITGPTSTTEGRYQFDMIARTHAQCKKLADAARAALNGWSETSGGLELTSCHLESENDDFETPDTPGTDTTIYRVIQDYLMHYA